MFGVPPIPSHARYTTEGAIRTVEETRRYVVHSLVGRAGSINKKCFKRTKNEVDLINLFATEETRAQRRAFLFAWPRGSSSAVDSGFWRIPHILRVIVTTCAVLWVNFLRHSRPRNSKSIGLGFSYSEEVEANAGLQLSCP